VHITVAGNSLFAILVFSTAREIYAVQMVINFWCPISYNESTDLTDKYMVVYRMAWI
jgi:hypothetical protein